MFSLPSGWILHFSSSLKSFTFALFIFHENGCKYNLYIILPAWFQVQTLLNSVKWDDKGLAVAIAQNVDTGAILMQGFVNRDALQTTISSRKATFYSRSRSTLWTKGETSKNFINVHDLFFDCDRDSVCYVTFSSKFWISASNLFACVLSILTTTFFTDNIPWHAWWTYLPHWVRNLLLYAGFWFVGTSRGLHVFINKLACFLSIDTSKLVSDIDS